MTRPRLATKARVRWDARDGVHYLLWPECGLRLNESAAAVVELCDGTRTIDEIAYVLAGRFGAERRDIAGDAESFIAELRRRALIVE